MEKKEPVHVKADTDSGSFGNTSGIGEENPNHDVICQSDVIEPLPTEKLSENDDTWHFFGGEGPFWLH